MARRKREPETLAECQEAVDAAAFGLLVDAAEQYGLVIGPKYNIERCEEILRKGRERGIRPKKWSF